MNLKKLLPLASLCLCASLLTTACSKDEPKMPTEQPTHPTGTREATIAISLGAQHPTYFSFLGKDVSKLTEETAKTSSDWDIAFLGLNGLTNSSSNGPGKVALLRTETTDFDAIVNVTPFLDKSYTWTSDATISVTSLAQMPPREITGTFNKLLVDAYAFDMGVHPPKVNVSQSVFLVRTAAGDYAKLQLLGVADGYAGYRIRYAYLGTTGENKLPATPAPEHPKTPGEARIAVASAGGLETALQGEDLSQLVKLTVTSGTLSQKDLDFITKHLKIKELDLTDASLALEASDRGFDGNSSIKKLIAPASLVRTESKWFSNTLATEIIFPGDQLKYFGGAVYNEKLKSIVLPNSVEELGDGAFANSNYESITLSTSLKIIPKEAFKACRRLTKLTIPASVKEIRDRVFADCSRLKEVTFLCPAPKFTLNAEEENAFDGYDYDVDPTFIVPKGTREDYLSALDWSPKSVVAQRFVEAD